MSFTAASLRIHDTMMVADAMLRDEYEGLDEKLGGGKTATGKRIRWELVKRLENLTPSQLHYMVDAGLDEARKLAFLAICKTYDFIHEFLIEVLREKMIQMDFQITEGEYIAFVQRKSELHPELLELSESTKVKIREVLFRILAEVRIIDSAQSKVLQPQFLSQSLQKIIREDDPLLLRIFFMTSKDIEG